MSHHPMHPAIMAVLEVARQLSEARLLELVAVLENGQLKLETSVGRINHLLHCKVNESRIILSMLRHWHQQGRDEQGLADALQTAWLARATMREETPEISLVWTGPVSLPNLAHTTGGVLLKLIDEARGEVVVVNYTLSDKSRLARRVIEQMAQARRRGVQIVLIGNRLEENQIEVRRKHWPHDLAFPLLYTYRGDARDPKATL